MGRFAKETGGGDFKQPPAGTHVARCVRIVDLGTQRGEYQGVPNKREQVLVFWELPNETFEKDGAQVPFLVTKFYTVSLSEKANLRKDLESWRGRGFSEAEKLKFDIMNILDKPCLLSIIINAKGKAEISSVSGLAKGMTCPGAHNLPYAFWIAEWDQKTFDEFGNGLKAIIQRSDEYQERMGTKPKGDAFEPDNGFGANTGSIDNLDDDIPF